MCRDYLDSDAKTIICGPRRKSRGEVQNNQEDFTQQLCVVALLLSLYIHLYRVKGISGGNEQRFAVFSAEAEI
jgi:hypothetical protein